jgi:MOSC domain-containing protein YiiM
MVSARYAKRFVPKKKMWQGKLVSIHITPAGAQPMQSVAQIRALPGLGLEGDRYATQQGTYAPRPDGSRQVTLIEIEALQALAQEEGIRLEPANARRNLVTRGVPLNHLVGKRFKVGEVTLRGIRLCEPCDHLARLTEQKVLPALIHRGGLRAEILSEGIIQAGDAIEECACIDIGGEI